MREIQFAGRYIRRNWYRYLLGIALLCAVDVANTTLPLYTGRVTDALASGTLDSAGLLSILTEMGILALVIGAGRFCWRYFIFGASRTIERDMRADLYGHLQTLDASYFNGHKTGDLMAHFTNDLQCVREMLGMTVITTFDATVMLVLVLYRMIVNVSPRLTLVAVAPLVLIIFGDLFYGRIMHRRFMEKQEAFSELTDQVQESVSGIRVIKAFVQERKQLAAFEKMSLYTREKNLRVVELMALVMPLLDLIIGVSVLLTLLYGGYLAILGEITVGQFVAFESYVTLLVWPMIAVGECITSISRGLASLKRIVTIFDEKSAIIDGPQCDASIRELKGGIELKHLTFAYPGAAVNALKDVSVTVAPGETLAIIGRTGSGKSTLASLLERLYDVPEGELFFDGHTVRQVPLETLRRGIAYVPQDSFLFSDTVERNIAFGVEKATHEQVENAAKLACIHANIMEFPEQYDTLVGERGVTISGGQKQRCAIARALLKDAPVLLLDDALSAVDTATEEAILSNLASTRKGRTTIIIAHRISTIQNADHILVLDEGRAAEYGTHAELMALNGIYRGIYEKQQLERQLAEEGDA